MRHASLVLALAALAACTTEEDPAPAGEGPAGLDLAAAVPAGEARAGKIARPEELVGGPGATGRVGDFKLVNAKVAFVVQDAGPSGAMVGMYGGNVVDADVARPPAEGRDLLREQVPVAGFWAVDAAEVTVASDGTAGGPAVIDVRGKLSRFPYLPDLGIVIPEEQARGLAVTHRYELAPDAEVLRIRTVIANQGDVPVRPLESGDAWIFGGRLDPFVPGKGYVDAQGGTSFAARGEGVAYAVGTRDGADFPLVFSVTSIAGAIASSQDLAPGTSVTLERWLAVGQGGVSVPLAAVREAQGQPLASLAGRVLDAGGAPVPRARVPIAGADGKLVGELDADAEGRFSGRLPPGEVLLGATAAGRAAVAPSVAVTLEAGGSATADVVLGAPGRIRARVVDGDGDDVPARLLLSGPAADRLRVPLLPGDNLLDVEPGAYTAVVSRGFEHDYAEVQLEVPAGGEVPLEVTLSRVIDSTGFVSGDFHLHSEGSPDSRLGLELRVAAIAAEGVEWAVATDHDQITDYAGAIERQGLVPHLAGTVGEEISTTVLGHFNAWPLAPRPGMGGGGGVVWTGLTPGEIARAAREAGAELVQQNHPRASLGTFNAIDLDPETLTARADPADVGLPAGADLDDLPFDAIEAFNAKRIDELFGGEGQPGAFHDWRAFVDRGHRVTLTGNSDSHSLGQEPGYPRNYVASETDAPGEVDPAALTAALKGGASFVSAGPFVRVSLEGVGLGGTGRPGTLEVEVQAAPWVPVDGVEVLERGVTPVATFTSDAGDLAAPPEVVRLRASVELSPAADTWYLVIARSDRRMSPVYDEPSLAITNPIYVDVAGDGWTPPLR